MPLIELPRRQDPLQDARFPQPSHHMLLPSPVVEFATPASWAAVAPNVAVARVLIHHSVDNLGWLICAVVHPPTFHAEAADFWARGADGFETCGPAWIALYFALLGFGVSPDHVRQMLWCQAVAGAYGADILVCEDFACLHVFNDK